MLQLRIRVVGYKESKVGDDVGYDHEDEVDQEIEEPVVGEFLPDVLDGLLVPSVEGAELVHWEEGLAGVDEELGGCLEEVIAHGGEAEGQAEGESEVFEGTVEEIG